MRGEANPVFPTVSKDSFFGTFNLRSLGIAMATAWFGAMLWSPSVVPPCYREQGLDMHMHVLRLVMLASLCLVYLLARVRPSVLFWWQLKPWAVAVGFAASSMPLLGVLFPSAASECSFPFWVDVLLWMCGGFSASAIMLVWGYRMETKKDYGQGVVNVAIGSAFSGAFFLSLSFLQYPVSVAVVACLPYLMLVVWAICRKSEKINDVDAFDGGRSGFFSTRTSVRAALGGTAPAFVFTYGFVMGLAGAMGTRFEIDGYSPLYVGAASLVAGVGMLYMARTGRLKMGRRLFYAFLPLSVACLLLFSIGGEKGEVLLLFIVFASVNACNVLNTAYESENALCTDAASASLAGGYSRFVGESRTADMFGSALGWAAGIVALFFVNGQEVPYWYFFLALGLVIVVTVIYAFKADDRTASVDACQSFESLTRQWDDGCVRLARTHNLSAREQEVFLLLSRGRDRQYIHEKLGISPNTVRTHAYNLYRKLGVHDQQQLIDLVESELARDNG